MQQFFFRSQLALALGSNLADKNIAGTDASAHANHAVLIEVGQCTLADIGNVASELFTAQLGLANLHVIFLNVNRGENVFLHQPLADDDGILKVVAVVSKERDQHVSAQGQF